jgi:hypothetical protein
MCRLDCSTAFQCTNTSLTDVVDVIPAYAGMTGLAKVLMPGMQEQLSHFLNIVVVLRYSRKGCLALEAGIFMSMCKVELS